MNKLPSEVWYEINKFNNSETVFKRYKATQQELTDSLINRITELEQLNSVYERQLNTVSRINRSLRRRCVAQRNRAEVLQNRIHSLEIERNGRMIPLSVYRTLDFNAVDSLDDDSTDYNTDVDILEDTDVEI